MRAGRLKFIVSFQRLQPTMVFGAEVKGFVHEFFERAAIEPLRGTELLASMQVNAEIKTRIVTRWSPKIEAVDATWTIVWKNAITKVDTVYEIVEPPINSTMARREMVFMCKSGTNCSARM